MQVFSYSRLSMGEEDGGCLAKLFRRYVLKMAEPPTLPLVEGKGAHAVIEAALKTKQDSKEFFSSMCDVVIGVSPLRLDKDELMYLTYQPNVLECIGKPGNIEYHFQELIDPDDPFGPEIQGYIDHWLEYEDFIELRDWKSNRKSYDPITTQQLGIYAGHLQRKTSKPVKGKLVFLRTREIFEHLYTPEDGITTAQTWALNTADNIRNLVKLYEDKKGTPEELFPATPGDVCRYCGWADFCTGKEIICPEDLDYTKAVGVASEVFRLETAVDLLKEKLKVFVKHNGPVRVGKREFCFAPSRYWTFSGDGLKKAVDKMKKGGVDPFGVLSLTAKGLKKLNWGEAEIKALGGTLKTSLNFKDVAAEEVVNADIEQPA